jgi:hypothetical protein
MVIQEGSCWVRRDDGSWQDLAAKSVVVWDPVSGWSTAIFAEAFGLDALG